MKINASDRQFILNHPTEPRILGQIITREYEEQGVLRHQFSNGKKTLNLGPSSMNFHFIDWPEIFNPILNQGYEVQKLVLARGGLKIHAVLVNMKGPRYRDPLDWDSQTWGESEGLLESVVINAGMKPGYGYHFRRGFYRVVCTNGLIVPSLQLGSADFNHQTFTPDKMLSALFGREVIVGEDIVGNAVGKKKALKKVSEVVQKIQSTEDLEETPPFMRKVVAPLTDLSPEVRSNVVEQFENLVNSKRNDVYELDIANVVTTAVNRPEKVAQRSYFQMEKLQRSLSDLTGIFSL
jgi:hypothetical protein